MIIVVAIYDGSEPEKTQFLAASKKIRAIIKLLKQVDAGVVLLNSGHQISVKRGYRDEKVDFGDGCVIDVVTPPTMFRRWFGQCKNIINVDGVVNYIINNYGVPRVAWFYNGYAFEMCVASILKKRFGTRNIIEFEDWHFARSRGLNPKPLIDWWFWRLALNNLDVGFAVNDRLAHILELNNVATKMLPGLVSDKIASLASQYPPFTRNEITIGYFGGLSVEKGADIVLRLVTAFGANIKFIVTGVGPLSSRFIDLSVQHPKQLSFLGAVSDDDLILAISKVDVIINPHPVNDGVFPFKVLEAVASGRLVVSTMLPMKRFETELSGVEFYNGDVDLLKEIIIKSRQIYISKKESIAVAAQAAATAYGTDKLLATIRILCCVPNEVV